MIKRTSKKILLGAIITILVATAVAVYVYFNATTNEDRTPINYPGPTEQDVKDAEDNKQKVQERKNIEAQAKNNQSTGEKQVSPQITNASQVGNEVVVNAYIAGVFEDGGTCKMVFTQGSKVVYKSTKAFADATTTVCAPLHTGSVELGSGAWSVVVEYSSRSAQGVSQAESLVIQ